MNQALNQYLEMVRYIDRHLMGRQRTKKLSIQFACKGSVYARELMVVGRSVNGWDDGWQPGISDEVTERYITTRYSESSMDDLKWVHDQWKPLTNADGKKMYCTGRSAFWQLVKDVTEQLVSGWSKDTWAQKIVWSNLYKVAPAGGGNPGSILARVQQSFCKEILLHEIETYRPRKILFVTCNKNVEGGDLRAKDHWFVPFDESVTDICTKLGIQFVVCKRPERNNRDRLLQEILNECQ